MGISIGMDGTINEYELCTCMSCGLWAVGCGLGWVWVWGMGGVRDGVGAWGLGFGHAGMILMSHQ